MARRNKPQERDLALERIRHLVGLAVSGEAAGEPGPRIQRYVGLARRIAMRYQVSIPPELRRRLCRECDAVLVSGRTARHRITGGRMSVTCLRCGAVKRYPFKPRRALEAR